ncbi:MAG: hypothetical protein J5J00_03130 [Deltaproteobacteria bacterium]|nr:hypothetical protein [Deltaproteobacteria bacterium]
MKAFLFFFLFAMHFAALPLAESQEGASHGSSDPRGAAELTICSQNLNNYGTPAATAARLGLTKEEFDKKQSALVSRFKRAGCDVIAVQEVVAKSQLAGDKVLQQLASALKEVTHRKFEVKTGSSNDSNLRNGFLVASDRAEIVNALSYSKVELPKISEKQKPRFFSRGPLEIQLTVKSRGGTEAKTVTLINLHFKSQSGGRGDPTGLEWETHRMEMSEALRRIIESRHKGALARGDSILVVLGDRNSNFDLASSRILEGGLILQHFQGEAPCRLSKRGVPLCQENVNLPQILFSVLREDRQTRYLTGTFHYKGTYSWLDDILLPAESLRTAWERYDIEGDYNSGVLFTPEAASDHALVWVKLNW